jgi:SCP-2 sterol transfer family
MPEFAEAAEENERRKSERLGPAIEAALARREPARTAPAGYAIDEAAEVARAQRPRQRPASLRDATRTARKTIERHGQEVLGRLVRGASDEQLERRFGNQIAQRVIFAGMARQFDPQFAFGFEGDIQYELGRRTDGAAPDSWTIRVKGDRARAIPGPSPEPAVTLRFAIPDFARVVAEEMKPQELLFSGRFDVAGDYQVASRLSEMFGGPSQT